MADQAFAGPVTEVTLLEDRAQVHRVVRADLPAGRSTLLIEGVAPVLSDKTLWAKFLRGPDGAQVVDLRVRRERVVSSAQKPAEVGVLEVELNELKESARRRVHHQGLVDRERDRLGDLSGQMLSEMSHDVAWGRSQAVAWAEQWQAVFDRELAAVDGSLNQVFECQDLQRQINDLSTRIAAAESPATRCAALLELDLQLPEPGAVSLRLSYVVPGACWRPAYMARLLDAGGREPRLSLRSVACVWQCTGEDWEDVQLSFSTQRPSLGVEPPRLTTDRLAVQEKRRVVELQTREQEIETTGAGAAKNLADGLPGIDDGGDALLLQAPGRATVRSDGRATRIPLFSFETGAKVELVCLPEVEAAVVIKTTATNEADKPLLAGPVELIRDHGYVGRTQTLFVAPDERFELGWGPDPALRVHRDHRQLKPKKKRLGTRLLREHRVTVCVSNLESEPRRLSVRERVPVSEVEQVTVEVDGEHTTDAIKPDEDGFLDWDVTVAGYHQSQLELRYQVVRHSKTVEG